VTDPVEPDGRGASGVRRVLTIAAVVATLVGLPAVLLGGALLRHVGHVAPSVTSVVELRQRVLGHGIDCNDPKPDGPVTEHLNVVSALRCGGTGPRAMRLETFASTAAREKTPFTYSAWIVEGANWRIYTGDEDLARRLARVLTGKARYYRV
jgi:hypothetical protein